MTKKLKAADVVVIEKTVKSNPYFCEIGIVVRVDDYTAFLEVRLLDGKDTMFGYCPLTSLTKIGEL